MTTCQVCGALALHEAKTGVRSLPLCTEDMENLHAMRWIALAERAKARKARDLADVEARELG